MPIRLEKAYLAGSRIEDDTEVVDAKRELWTVALPSDLQARVPLPVPPRLYAVIILSGGEEGDTIRLAGYFVTPDGDISPSIVYTESWKGKGRHIAIIRLETLLHW